jgi:putative spermidine/putrescine transport system permease protein
VVDPTFTTKNYEWFFTTDVNVAVMRRTFGTAALVTLVCLLISYPYAYLMTIVGSRMRALMFMVVLIPLWTSLMIRTLAWVVLLQDTGLINDALEAVGLSRLALIRTTTGVAIGMTQVLLPFMVLPLYSVLSKIDRRLLLAAASMGARPVTAFRTVYLPLSRPGIYAGSLTVFVLALGFYIIPSLLGSPENTMLSALIAQQIEGLLQWGRGSAMGIVLLLSTFISLGLLMLLAFRDGKGVSTEAKS